MAIFWRVNVYKKRRRILKSLCWFLLIGILGAGVGAVVIVVVKESNKKGKPSTGSTTKKPTTTKKPSTSKKPSKPKPKFHNGKLYSNFKIIFLKTLKSSKIHNALIQLSNHLAAVYL